MFKDNDINDEQLIKDAQIRKEVTNIIQTMQTVKALPKPEPKILQYLHLHKINKGKKVSDKTRSKYRYKDTNGKVISNIKHKKMLERTIIAQLKEKPELAYAMINNDSIARQAVRSDMYDVYKHIIDDPKARKIIHDNPYPLIQAIYSDDKKYYNEILKYDELMTARLPTGQGILYTSIKSNLDDHKFISTIITKHPETLFHATEHEPNVGLMAVTIKQIYQHKRYIKSEKHKLKNFIKNSYDYIIDSVLQACEKNGDDKVGQLAAQLVDKREVQFYPHLLKNINWLKQRTDNPESNFARLEKLNNYKQAKKIKDDNFDKVYKAQKYGEQLINFRLARAESAKNTDKTPIQKV